MTDPYYSDDHVTLYHADCLDQLAWLSADVLITDPPYGTQFTPGNTKGGYGRRDLHGDFRGPDGFTIAGDDTTDTRDTILALWKERGPVAMFGSPRQPDPPGHWADRLVWDKKRPGINGGPWRYRHETIYATAGFLRANNSAVSIIEAYPDQTDHMHAKPIALMTRLIAAAPPGLIADPFAGSGSTLVAAKALNRPAIGIELEERFCEIAARRLAQDALDLPLPQPAIQDAL